MKINSLLIVSLLLLSGNVAWAACAPPKCPWNPTPSGPHNPLPVPPGPRGFVNDFATIVDCQKACATCGVGQVCYCDPGSGFSCAKGPQNFSLFINDENGFPVIQEE